MLADRFAYCLLLLLVALPAGCGESASDSDAEADDDLPNPDDDSDDDSVDDDSDAPMGAPPLNPYLADSPWPMAHANPYCQDSSPLAGPEAADNLATDFLPGTPVGVFPLFGNADENGERALWVSTSLQIYTIDANQTPLTTIDWLWKDANLDNLMSGAYTVLDHEGRFFVPQGAAIAAFGHETAGDVRSPIAPLAVFDLPEASADESVIGLNLAYDGTLMFATSAGRVGAVDRDFHAAHVRQLSGDEDVLSNSIAVDEDGGVYVVTSRRVYRVQWTGDELTLDGAHGAWSAAYEAGPATLPPGRLSLGSGTTPTLMGFGDRDKFVVICDGQQVMHLVLFWRDHIPDDWVAIAPGKDRRIAAELPVTFGQPELENTSTEQSLTVWEYDIAVVNNYYGPHAVSGFLAAALSNLPPYAPYGVEKFRWDPARRRLASVWSNPAISCPNGVPGMSAGSGLLYCLGQRDIAWTLEAIDWGSGASAFHVVLGDEFKFNSFWAAVEIGPVRNVVSGTVFGTLDIRPR
jgi:hypothetical protein